MRTARSTTIARGDAQPVEHQMRPVPQQPAVLDRRWFALFAIGDRQRAADGRRRGTALAALRPVETPRRHGRARPDRSTWLSSVVGIVERAVAARVAIVGVVLGAMTQQPRRSMPGHSGDGEIGLSRSWDPSGPRIGCGHEDGGGACQVSTRPAGLTPCS